MAEFFKNIFYKSQRFLGVDLSYVLKGGFWLGLDQAASLAVGVASAVAFANLISQETYGIYRYVLSFFSILTIATLPNMGLALTTYVAKGIEGMLKLALSTRIRWGFLGSAASAAIAVYYFIAGNPILGVSFLILAVFLPFSDSFNLYSAYLQGKKLFKIQSQYSIFIRVISAAVMIGALFLTDNLFFILFAYFAPYILLRPIIFLATLKRFPPNDRQDPEMITFGKHLSVIQLIGVAVNYLDNLLIFNFLGAAPLAIYSIALIPITKLQQVLAIVSQLALPKFSARPLSEVKTVLPGRIFKALLLAAVGILFYIFIAPPVFQLIFPQYLESVVLTRWLALILLSWPFSLIHTFLRSQALKKELYKYNLAIRAVQLVAVSALVYFFGVAGAVTARLIFELSSIVILLLLFRSVKG